MKLKNECENLTTEILQAAVDRVLGAPCVASQMELVSQDRYNDLHWKLTKILCRDKNFKPTSQYEIDFKYAELYK